MHALFRTLQREHFLSVAQESSRDRGGGVVIAEVCVQCGCKRTTDTWAQDRSTGEQGLTSVGYERKAFSADEIARAS